MPILAFYGLFFLLVLPLYRLGAKPLALIAAGWALVGPQLLYALKPVVGGRVFLSYGQADGLVSLFFTGGYPALTWVPFVISAAGGHTSVEGCAAAAEPCRFWCQVPSVEPSPPAPAHRITSRLSSGHRCLSMDGMSRSTGAAVVGRDPPSPARPAMSAGPFRAVSSTGRSRVPARTAPHSGGLRTQRPTQQSRLLEGPWQHF
ncbi:hypothetical protein [Streptomyces viridochromogenes]|uniref:hypothetical protein n=1 Tax=Streptomyces viridochromogenes TaxID=1938 RepID=UPI000AE0C051